MNLHLEPACRRSDSAVRQRDAAFGQQLERQRINLVLDREDARGKRRLGVDPDAPQQRPAR